MIKPGGLQDGFLTIGSGDNKVTIAISQREKDELEQQYAAAVGFLVLEWNHLHEDLARLFSIATKVPDQNTAYAIWHSTPSDLAQRKMLKAAISTLKKDDRIRREVEWLLEEIDHRLAPRRNDAMHAPVDVVFMHDGAVFESNTSTGNPRAKALWNKEIIQRIAWYRETTNALRRFATSLYHVHVSHRPWPDRPKLPDFQPPSPPMEKRNKERPPKRGLPPESSPE